LFLLLGVALVSAAALAFELTLTRIFAIAQGYHFGFLAISLALLGFGASGSALALHPALARDAVMPRLARLSLGFSLSLIASYLAINYLPFDSYRIAFERAQLLYLLLYYLALVAPFFLGGLVLGLPLAAFPAQTTRVYAANLAGAGVGCVAALGALTIFDAPGAVIFSALLAACGALAFWRMDRRAAEKKEFFALIALAALLIAPPPLFDVQTSPYKSYSQILRFPDARLVLRAWNAFSRVDVVESAAVRSAPGLSLTYAGAMPAQRALFQDAESISPLTDAAPPALLDALPATLAYRLRPNARALLLKPGGGIEALAALNAGAREIVVVEDNPLVADVARRFAPRVFGDARVRVAAGGARSFAARSREKFDLAHLALSDPFRPVTAGAYALGENYLYTREAFRDYLNHLDDDGILVVSRWLQLPPTEEARAGALAIAALEDRARDPREHILALRSFNTLLLLVKRAPFTAREVEIAKTFAEERRFDWIAYPGMRAEEANRFNVLRGGDDYHRAFQQLLDPDQRARFLATYAYDIAPPTDDRPFFFHFFKWEQTPQVLQLMGKLWQPFGGSGYLILLALLALSIAASAALILLPLRALPRGSPTRDWRWIIYFAMLGIGFLFVEIPLIQRFILFLDHPVYAFATVVFALLLASGAGSLLSTRLPHRAALALLVAAILAYPRVLPGIFQIFLGDALGVRVGVSLVLLAPIGFLMGVPFPKGLAWLNERAPSRVPLAWGINGCASVISAILATMGAIAWGFSSVILAGAGAYALALLAIISRASAGRKSLP
jgi:spermidine synthase